MGGALSGVLLRRDICVPEHGRWKHTMTESCAAYASRMRFSAFLSGISAERVAGLRKELCLRTTPFPVASRGTAFNASKIERKFHVRGPGTDACAVKAPEQAADQATHVQKGLHSPGLKSSWSVVRPRSFSTWTIVASCVLAAIESCLAGRAQGARTSCQGRTTGRAPHRQQTTLHSRAW